MTYVAVYPLIHSSEWGMYTSQIEYVSQTPGFWSNINFSQKVRYQMKAKVIVFLLRNWAGVDPPASQEPIGES